MAEALANVSQHAQASTCRVRLAHEDDRLTITVTDDGRGIDPDYTPGLGLASLRGRALELGGDLHVGPGQAGTILAAHLPIGDAR